MTKKQPLNLMKELKEAKKYFYKETQRMINAADKKMYLTDIYALACIKRAVLLISGFCQLIEAKNFLSAAPLIRLHLDTLLQFYAVWLVEDPNKFVTKKMAGKQTNNIKDKEKIRMTDSYLVKKLTE